MKLTTGVEIFMGLPGSGKSTMGAILAKKHLKSGYNVYSNYPISGCRKLDCSKDIMTYNLEHALIIIDEAGLEYDNRSWQEFSKKSLEFFKTHRHYHLRIILFSQFWDDVDKKIRTLTNKIYVIRRSFIPFFVMTKEIRSSIGISDEHQIIMQYDWKMLFPRKHYCVLSARMMFDSWSHPPLKERIKWPVYDIPIRKSCVQLFFKRMKEAISVSSKKCNLWCASNLFSSIKCRIKNFLQVCKSKMN